ncbi:methyltransferase domain-containing protein [Candidatus Bipolaricaulota bacterium]|nr:methyltransferase domain-containing protein [Candidatus Bipolaricaulota bacterium]
MTRANTYDERYARPEYYWGKKPSTLCERVIELAPPREGSRPKLLDLGCGEGRDCVYFARHGFDVVGLDLSEVGLAKARRYAEEIGVQVRTVCADIVAYELDDLYHVIFSTGTLHYLPKRVRTCRFQDYKEHTTPGGIHALTVFVEKPFIPRAPDAEENSHPYRSGELLGYYWDWEILYCTEEIFDCRSSGIPHRHAVNRVIARKPGG